MDISVHDNRLISYCVLSETHEIRMHTIYEDREPYEYTDVVFSGVVAYYFEQDTFKTILFDIEEEDIARIYDSNRDRFAAGQNYGWPGMWNKSEQTALEYLASLGVKGFTLSSVCGMSGWVLAKSMSKFDASSLL